MTDYILANAPVSIPAQDLPMREGRKPFQRTQGLWQVAGYGHPDEVLFEDAGPVLYPGHDGTKRIFIYQHGDTLAASTSLLFLTEWMRSRGFATRLNEVAAWCMLSFGYMLEDCTPVAGVSKLMAGVEARAEGGKWVRRLRVDFRGIETRNRPLKLWIQSLESSFKKGVDELGQSPEPGVSPRVTLSGGLDSRLVAWFAAQKYRQVSLGGTGQKEYLDHELGRKVARLLAQPYYYHVLDPGSYLNDFQSPVALNEGLVFYNGSAHMIPLMKVWQGDGTMWTGMLGDALLGSYLSAPEKRAPQLSAGAMHAELAPRALEAFPGLEVKYPDEVTYKLYNRGFNAMNNGFWTAEPFGGFVSPFMTEEFIKLSLSIPEKLRYRQGIYLHWLLERHPRLAAIPWEATRTPVSSVKATHRAQQRMRWIMAWNYKVLKDDSRVSMLPYLHWDKVNPLLEEKARLYVEARINHLPGTLAAEARKLFGKGGVSHRGQVITLLETIEYLQLT